MMRVGAAAVLVRIGGLESLLEPKVYDRKMEAAFGKLKAAGYSEFCVKTMRRTGDDTKYVVSGLRPKQQ